MTDLHVDPVTVEHHREPLGIGEAAPRLSWVTRTERPGWSQRAYEIEVTDADSGATVTTSRVDSIESVLVPWPVTPLTDRERRSVRVRVWGRGKSIPSDWSEPTALEVGLLDPDEWRAVMVGPVLPAPGTAGNPRRCCGARSGSPARSAGPGSGPPHMECCRYT
jgi:alpha-L-rhamnosidase